MIVELTNACNLRCKYCFENCQTEERQTSKMTKGILEKAIDFLLDNNRENCHLTFFGGEPLLCKELIVFGMEYGNKTARKRKKYISYSLVTNGTELDDAFIEVLNDNNVNIVYSFDGNEFSQNKYRPYASGEGTYDVVLGNLKKIIKSRKDERYGHLIVRPTITSETVELLNDIYEKLVEVGCREVSFSLVSAEKDKDYAIKNEDLDNLHSSYEKMTNNYYYELLSERSYNKFFESILERIESNVINKEFCDCGKRYIAVDVKGDVYPCEGFIGVEEFKMGNIITDKVEKTWVNPENVDENMECKKCWARYLCGGSCYHEAWMKTGVINGRDKLVCETYKMAFEYALKLYVKLKKENICIKNIVGERILPERSVPFIIPNVIRRVEKDVIYICDGRDNNFVTLNETGQRVFELCNGVNSILDISNMVMKEFECEFDIYSDISGIINLLLDVGLIGLTV